MGWYPQAERVHNPYVGAVGTLKPVAAIAHRTYGRYAGDMSVMTGGRPGIAFHLYVTKDGRVFQAADTTAKCSHAKGANSWSVGIEVESLNNDDPMTIRQMQALGLLCGWLSKTHGIPLEYDPGPVRKGERPGFLAHASIAGSDHGDKWTLDEWAQIKKVAVGGAGEDRPTPVTTEDPQGDDGTMAMIKYGDNQLHSFDVDDHNLWHRWFDPKVNRWIAEVLAGPKAADSLNRDQVDNLLVSCVKYGEQLHVTAGQTHAWFDPANRRWYSERLP